MTGAFVAASVLLWTAIALIEAGPAYLEALQAGDGGGAAVYLLRALARWYSWGLLAPAIFWLARRYPIDRRFWRSLVLVHLPASLVANTIHLTAWLIIRWFTYPPDGFSFLQLARAYFNGYFAFNLLAYWAILGGAYTVGALRRLGERELSATRLEAELARARLAALTARLQPHFLFNTLHAVSELIHRQPRVAERMVVGLGDMLRTVVEHSDRDEVRLREELELVEAYLAIERARFGRRLDAVIDADPTALDARLPLLTIQPLVENAIRHGFEGVPDGHRLDVDVRREGDRLRIRVVDSGRGPPARLREGVGLGTIRSRLDERYGGASTLTIAPASPRGTVVELRIPFVGLEAPAEAGSVPAIAAEAV